MDETCLRQFIQNQSFIFFSNFQQLGLAGFTSHHSWIRTPAAEDVAPVDLGTSLALGNTLALA